VGEANDTGCFQEFRCRWPSSASTQSCDAIWEFLQELTWLQTSIAPLVKDTFARLWLQYLQAPQNHRIKPPSIEPVLVTQIIIDIQSIVWGHLDTVREDFQTVAGMVDTNELYHDAFFTDSNKQQLMLSRCSQWLHTEIAAENLIRAGNTSLSRGELVWATLNPVLAGLVLMNGLRTNQAISLSIANHAPSLPTMMHFYNFVRECESRLDPGRPILHNPWKDMEICGKSATLRSYSVASILVPLASARLNYYHL
jgi:hypothetical protein